MNQCAKQLNNACLQADLQPLFDAMHEAQTRSRDMPTRSSSSSSSSSAPEVVRERIVNERVDPMGGRYTEAKVLAKEHLSNDTIALLCDVYHAVSTLGSQPGSP